MASAETLIKLNHSDKESKLEGRRLVRAKLKISWQRMEVRREDGSIQGSK